MQIFGPHFTLTEWETMELGAAFKPIKNCSQTKWHISAKKKGLGQKKKKKAFSQNAIHSKYARNTGKL